MLTQYIYRNRGGKRVKVGMFVGLVIDGEIRIGYSLCCKTDEFDADVAFSLAGIRALSPETDWCPPSIEKDAIEFAGRCLKYFKGASLPTIEEPKEYFEGKLTGCMVEVG